jgi:hypothetical protein
LEYKPQTSTAVRTAIQNIDIRKSLILTKSITVKETLFGFLRLDAMVSQMLDVAVFLILVIPFKRVPNLRH